VPFRFHDLTIVAINAHLPADGRTGSRVMERNAALRELLSASGNDYDLHLKYNHTILLGK